MSEKAQDAPLEQVDAELWVVYPGDEPHWGIDNWIDDGAKENPVPWWLMSLWLVYLVWGVLYLLDGASQW